VRKNKPSLKIKKLLEGKPKRKRKVRKREKIKRREMQNLQGLMRWRIKSRIRGMLQRMITKLLRG